MKIDLSFYQELKAMAAIPALQDRKRSVDARVTALKEAGRLYELRPVQSIAVEDVKAA